MTKEVQRKYNRYALGCLLVVVAVVGVMYFLFSMGLFAWLFSILPKIQFDGP